MDAMAKKIAHRFIYNYNMTLRTIKLTTMVKRLSRLFKLRLKLFQTLILPFNFHMMPMVKLRSQNKF
jgi:hypothetical protein